MGVYRAWVEFPYISDHAPIVLQLDSSSSFKAFPFKFNPLWSTDQDFIEMVQKLWSDPKYLLEVGRQRRLVWKLKDLKVFKRNWKKEERYRKSCRLYELEKEITFKIQNSNDVIINNFGGQSLKFLEQERMKLIHEMEEQWSQHNCVIWLHSGDQNTKFFHNYASFRRNSKFLWELKDEEGQTHSG